MIRYFGKGGTGSGRVGDGKTLEAGRGARAAKLPISSHNGRPSLGGFDQSCRKLDVNLATAFEFLRVSPHIARSKRTRGRTSPNDEEISFFGRFRARVGGRASISGSG